MAESGGNEVSLLELAPEQRNARLTRELRAAVTEIEPLIVTSHGAQQEIHRFLEQYDARGPGRPLPPRSLHTMRRESRDYLRLQERLGEVAARYEPLALLSAEQAARLALDPALVHAGVAMSTAAAVTLYDNYLSMLQVLKDDRLRRLVNDADVGYGIEEGELREIVDALNSKRNRRRLHHLVDRWNELEEEEATSHEQLAPLRHVIDSSISYRYARDGALDRRLPTKHQLRRTRFLDGLDRLAGEAVGALSRAFGNGIGMIATRKGKLWRRPAIEDRVASALRPLDLLLEKTPFRLTDQFIPGHFGHVAIWMGTAEEIEALGVWEQPAMQSERLAACRQDIERGASVLEALRPGVELNTLAQFLNVDDLAVLRPRTMDRADRIASLVRGFQQVGKDYDFNFDVETTGTIVCSELPYHVYPGVTWTTEQQLGRFTISPDHIALEAIGASALFDVVLFYRDGTLLDAAEARRVFAELVG